ncbi:MAG: hypothetical protein ACRDZV_07680, partial [Acidimicrobiia bacterium]
TTTFRCIPSAPVVPRLVGPGDHTLQDLKDGVADLGGGVTPTTPVAVVVGIVSEVSSVPEVFGDVNATVDSLLINGVEQL